MLSGSLRSIECFIEDPTTKRHQPRGYLQTLEGHIALLERFLAKTHPDLSLDHLLSQQSGTHAPEEYAREGTAVSDVLSDAGVTMTDAPAHTRGSAASTQLLEAPSATPTGSAQEHDLLYAKQLEGSAASPTGSDGLSSEVGLLCLRAAGQAPSHYFGSSSSFSFSKIIFSSLGRVRSQGTGLSLSGLANPQLLELTPPIPAPLPSQQIGRLLSDAYFNNLHPQVRRRVPESLLVSIDDTFISIQYCIVLLSPSGKTKSLMQKRLGGCQIMQRSSS